MVFVYYMHVHAQAVMVFVYYMHVHVLSHACTCTGSDGVWILHACTGAITCMYMYRQ